MQPSVEPVALHIKLSTTNRLIIPINVIDLQPSVEPIALHIILSTTNRLISPINIIDLQPLVEPLHYTLNSVPQTGL